MLQSNTYIVNLGHSRVTNAGLVEMSRKNLEMMDANPKFPTPIPWLPLFEEALDRLVRAIDDYRFNPSRLGKSERDQAFRALKTKRRELGSYVQAQSEGDLDVIGSAGFAVERKPQPSPKPNAPANVRAQGTKYPNEVLVQFNGVKGKLYYRLFICSGDPTVETNWRFHTAVSKNRVLLTGMESDRPYHFRVVAVGAAGASPVSEPATAKAA